MIEDFERCYRIVQSRDARFDGWFYSGVTSTGIYCRPSCPARTPKRENITFHPSAAAAQQAGFRACKRCRPDAAPGSPEWDSRADVVARAMRLIADGVVDRTGVPGLAATLGYSARQLQRLLLAEVGAGPLAIARAQRAQTARTLVETTDLPMADVAFAAGFSSVRQFNDTVRAVYASTPGQLRARVRRPPAERTGPETGADLVLRLAHRSPLEPANLFGHLAATAVPGVEEVADGGWYRRTLRLPHGPAIVALRPAEDHVACRLRLTDVRDLTAAIARCRRLLDLDADPEAVDARLATDPVLAPLVAAAPGRRVPRTVDGSEMALRAVLGQQVSTRAARTIAGRLAAEHGDPVDDPSGGLSRLFPEAAALVDAPLPLPARRRATLGLLAAHLASGHLDLGPGCDRDRARALLASVDGIGPWTAQVIAMRAMGDADVLLATDLGTRRSAALLGLGSTPADLEERSAAWRPWRSYAVQHLWSVLDHDVNRWPPRAAEGDPSTDRAA